MIPPWMLTIDGDVYFSMTEPMLIRSSSGVSVAWTDPDEGPCTYTTHDDVFYTPSQGDKNG